MLLTVLLTRLTAVYKMKVICRVFSSKSLWYKFISIWPFRLSMNYSYRLKNQLKKKSENTIFFFYHYLSPRLASGIISENTIFFFLPLFITESCLWDNMNARSFNMKICKIHSEVLKDTFMFKQSNYIIILKCNFVK